MRQKNGNNIRISDMIKDIKKDTEQKDMERYGFNEIYYLNEDNKYKGKAELVILVWSYTQILPAEQLRKTSYPNKKVDIAVCQDPNVQKKTTRR